MRPACRSPGTGQQSHSLNMDLDYHKHFAVKAIEALIGDLFYILRVNAQTL
jgi:hypothetical protein